MIRKEQSGFCENCSFIAICNTGMYISYKNRDKYWQVDNLNQDCREKYQQLNWVSTKIDQDFTWFLTCHNTSILILSLLILFSTCRGRNPRPRQSRSQSRFVSTIETSMPNTFQQVLLSFAYLVFNLKDDNNVVKDLNLS